MTMTSDTVDAAAGGLLPGGESVAAPTTPGSQPTAPADYTFVPEKHRVFKEDGTPDVDGMLRRVDKQRSELERRIGSVGERRPDTAAEYQLEVPEAQQPFLEALGEDQLNAFRELAHSKGFTGEQFNTAIASFLEVMPQLVAGQQQFDMQTSITELRKEWTTDEVFADQVGKSRRALAEFGGADAKVIVERYGNDPALIRAWAKVGATMGSDRAPSPAGGASGAPAMSAQDYARTNWQAYSDPRHPQHAAVTATFTRMSRAEVGPSGDFAAL